VTRKKGVEILEDDDHLEAWWLYLIYDKFTWWLYDKLPMLKKMLRKFVCVGKKGI
jgi:hypothetical protein